jgi:hypothetical protein
MYFLSAGPPIPVHIFHYSHTLIKVIILPGVKKLTKSLMYVYLTARVGSIRVPCMTLFM